MKEEYCFKMNTKAGDVVQENTKCLEIHHDLTRDGIEENKTSNVPKSQEKASVIYLVNSRV